MAAPQFGQNLTTPYPIAYPATYPGSFNMVAQSEFYGFQID